VVESFDPASVASPADRSMALLAKPGAGIAAVGADGLLVPLPPGLADTGHRVIEARSGVDIVVAGDRVRVIQAWLQVRQVGYAAANVHLIAAPDDPVTMHFLDMTETRGVYVMVIVPSVDSGKSLPIRELTQVTPRLARVRKDSTAVLIEVDEAASGMFGWSRDELIGRRSLDFIHPDDQALAIDSWMQMLGSAGLSHRVRLRHGRKDGSWLWVEITNLNLLNDPVEPHVNTELVDVSDEMAALEALRAQKEMLQKLAEALPNGVVRFECDGRVAYVNRRLAEVMGDRRAVTISEQFALVAFDDQPRLYQGIDAVLGGDDVDVEVRLTIDGQPGEHLCQVTLRPLTDADGAVTGAIACVTDTTESTTLRAELERRATTDTLTGCSARAVAIHSLEHALANIGDGAAVVFIDLDRFKEVNDRFGHRAGDDLLKVLAERLKHVARPSDCVGRVGGDEFVVICPGVDNGAQARMIADRFASALKGSVTIGDLLIEPTASVGVAFARPGGRTNADELIAEADVAMYESKRVGTGHAVLYSPEMRSSSLTS
jgi:diguanylate cyclase (GGDEF)-like protein/PAS domain S-box-containing protein